MKILLVMVLGVVVIFIGVRIIGFLNQEASLRSDLSDIESRLMAAKAQEANLRDETEYLENSANLEKELRTQFNYKKPGEKMIIIVPGQSSTAP